jgi:predicted GNAT family acetyltransferase
MLLARGVREIVTGPLGFRLAAGDDLAAVAKFHEIFMRATAEDGQTDQERQNQFTFESVRAHFSP